MAIYHLTAKVGQRSKGKSAAAKAAYICRASHYESRDDELVDHASMNMPSWAADDPRTFWDAAQAHERKNGVLFRELEFALPVELNSKQRVLLAAEFAKAVVGTKHPATLAVHAGRGHNPHVHMMFSERINDGHDRTPETWFKRANRKNPGAGGALKVDFSKNRGKWLAKVREDWARLCNEHLAAAGRPERVDHRSNEARGIEDVPGRHMGPQALAYEKRTGETSRRREWIEVRDARGSVEVAPSKQEKVSRAPAPQAAPKPTVVPAGDEKPKPETVPERPKRKVPPKVGRRAKIAVERWQKTDLWSDRLWAERWLALAGQEDMRKRVMERSKLVRGLKSAMAKDEILASGIVAGAMSREQHDLPLPPSQYKTRGERERLAKGIKLGRPAFTELKRLGVHLAAIVPRQCQATADATAKYVRDWWRKNRPKPRPPKL